ncbi:MAG TPA: DUF4215 domain-containing protein [Nannocystaceae bacterium]|nr:DUF4215 domain-containing protein [Nannocystaceae bacterium]
MAIRWMGGVGGLVWLVAATTVPGCGGDSGTGDGSGTLSGTTTTGTTGTTSTTGETGTSGESSTMDSTTFVMMTDPGTSGVSVTGTTGSTSDTTGAPDPFCGDGVMDPGEECDEGAANSDTGSCTSACKLPVCGDGFVQAGEACDDGNDDNGDGCVSGCVAASCGDGYVGPGEACDDPDPQVCTASCALPSCGDGVVQGAEECDDGNGDDTDACLSTCLKATCGDGAVYAGVEACDDGNAVESDGCTSLCEPPACDDGIKSGSESDVDCGGSCDACAAGQACSKGSECQTNVCKAGVCAVGQSCLEIHASSPMLPSGIYSVDLDGDGPEPQASVFCEMETDGGGWTLVQRTVWDPAETAALFTNYADWHGKTLGSVNPGKGYRLAGKFWMGLNGQKRHMLVHRVRKANSGESCGPLYYVGTDGTYAIDGANAMLTGLQATVNMINNTVLSTQSNGPGSACVTQYGGVPWFYSGCCTTCPTFAGSYWPQPHPMASYTAATLDYNNNVHADVCGGEAAAVSLGYYGINDMGYFIR